MASQYVKA